MASRSKLNATHTHRRRGSTRPVRVKVQALKKDAGLIQAVAATLLGEASKANALRTTLARALSHPEVGTAFDVFGSELPDEVFEGVFDHPRQRVWREVDL